MVNNHHHPVMIGNATLVKKIKPIKTKSVEIREIMMKTFAKLSVVKSAIKKLDREMQFVGQEPEDLDD